MTPKVIVPREQAEQDIDLAISHYLDEAGPEVAIAFIDALEGAFSHLASNPATGSPRYAVELNLPGLRYWPIKDFPFLVFYIERESHLDVWRVLHSGRDLPAWLQPDSTP